MAFQHPCEEDNNPTTNKSDKVHGYIHSSVCYKSVNTHGDAHGTQFGNKRERKQTRILYKINVWLLHTMLLE